MLRQFTIALVLLFSHAGFAADVPMSPVPMLETTANHMTEVLDNNKTKLKSDPMIVQNTVRSHLLPHVDVSGMARSVLGRNAWYHASADERKRFTKAFTDLVVRTYSAPLMEYTDEKIMFLPERVAPSGRFTRVNSVIIRPGGQRIPLSYSLVKKKDAWKIYDFSVEGVSLLQSFKSQFGQILRTTDMDTLIAELEAQAHKKEAA